MKIVRHFIVLFLLIGICGYLLFTSYQEVKKNTITDFNKNQLTYAKQAANSIQDFFNHYLEVLKNLSENPNITDLNLNGKELLRNFYTGHSHDIYSVNVIDNNGNIVYVYPYKDILIGRDISKQEHIQKIFKINQPIISDVFTTSQGFKSVAVDLPIFKDKIFKGIISVLIPFEIISKRYLENIKIGKDGYAWMISEKGIELYCPVPGHVGNSVFDNCKDFPDIVSMAKKMTSGEEGENVYTFNKVRGNETESLKKQAVYYPIKLGNTFWSIVVATPEDEILAQMDGFKNKWIIFITIIIIIALGWSFFSVKNIIKSEEEYKRKSVEDKLRKTEEKYRILYANMTEGICLHEIIYDENGKPKDYKITDINEAFSKITGLTKENVINQLASEVYETEEAPYLDIYTDVAIQDKPTTLMAS